MSLLMCTAGGEQHGLINTLANSNKDNGFEHMTPDMKKKCEIEKKEDGRMVKARYINHRGNHERLTKPYCRWSGEPIRIYHLIPQQEYELPMGFIKEVNGSGLIRRKKEDGPNDSAGIIEGKDRIHELVPVGF